jgi:hypothetical protein
MPDRQESVCDVRHTPGLTLRPRSGAAVSSVFAGCLAAASSPDQAVDEPELPHCYGRQHERIEVRLFHGLRRTPRPRRTAGDLSTFRLPRVRAAEPSGASAASSLEANAIRWSVRKVKGADVSSARW